MEKKKQTILIEGMRLQSVSNLAEHWSRRYRRNKKQRLALKWKTIEHDTPQLPCRITIVRIAPRLLDYDNLVSACKHIVDEVSSWILPGLAAGRADSDPLFSWIYLQEKSIQKRYALKILLEEM